MASGSRRADVPHLIILYTGGSFGISLTSEQYLFHQLIAHVAVFLFCFPFAAFCSYVI